MARQSSGSNTVEIRSDMKKNLQNTHNRHFPRQVMGFLLCVHNLNHDDVIKWKHFPCYWPFVQSPQKGQWRWALMFSLICAWINGWVNNREPGDLRRHGTHYDVTVMNILLLSLLYHTQYHVVICQVYGGIAVYRNVKLRAFSLTQNGISIKIEFRAQNPQCDGRVIDERQ